MYKFCHRKEVIVRVRDVKNWLSDDALGGKVHLTAVILLGLYWVLGPLLE